jgi:hypothetical protein
MTPATSAGTTHLDLFDYGGRVDDRTLDALRWRVALGTGMFAILPTTILVFLLTGTAHGGPTVPLLTEWPLFVAGAAFGMATYLSKDPAKTVSRAKVAGVLTVAGLFVLFAGLGIVDRGGATRPNGEHQPPVLGLT